MRRLLAQATDPFGKIDPTLKGTTPGDPISDLVRILNVGLTVVLIIAGLYALVQFLMAGFFYVTSAGDAKKVQTANNSITYAIIGLIIIVVTPLLAALIGIIVFKDPLAILNPKSVIKTF